MAPCLAEACTPAADGLSYAFTLRKGVRFHNGEPMTAGSSHAATSRACGTSVSATAARMRRTRTHSVTRAAA